MISPSKRVAAPAGRTVVRFAEAKVPTHHGEARFVVFRESVDGVVDERVEHVALVYGTPGPHGVLTRVHSECLTSEVFGSLKCDCDDQLHAALDRIQEAGGGVLIYLRQEGRGIGLGNKIRAYALQERGADTVDANHQLGFETDLRTYDVAAAMYADLGVKSVVLMTNNPDKVHGLEENGIDVVRRESVIVQGNEHSQGYLDAKRARLGHLFH